MARDRTMHFGWRTSWCESGSSHRTPDHWCVTCVTCLQQRLHEVAAGVKTLRAEAETIRARLKELEGKQ